MVDTCRSDAFTCVALAGYGRKRERHFLEPEGLIAVVVPDWLSRLLASKNAGCADVGGIHIVIC